MDPLPGREREGGIAHEHLLVCLFAVCNLASSSPYKEHSEHITPTHGPVIKSSHRLSAKGALAD